MSNALLLTHPALFNIIILLRRIGIDENKEIEEIHIDHDLNGAGPYYVFCACLWCRRGE